MSEHASVCPLDCPDTCSLTVTVEDAKIVKIRGSRANPYTAGVICTKVAGSYPEWVHGPGRLQTPLRRVGAKGEGRFAPVSWDEALDLIHERVTSVIAAHGPAGGPAAQLRGAARHARVRLDGPALLPQAGRLAAGPPAALRRHPDPGLARHLRHRAGHRARAGAPLQAHVAWGNNVTWSNLHLTPIINAARRDGAKVVVVDPKRIKIAEQADLHIALRPGTDVVLAWALAAELERRGALDREFIERHVAGFEEFMAQARRYSVAEAARICQVPEAQIRQLAEWYHTLSPASISVGNGLERNQNGGSGIRAIFALPALAGKFGVPGGGLVNGAGFAFPKTPARLQRPDLLPPGTRTLNIVDVGAHLLDPTLSPPIKALFVYNHNPLVVHPDQNRMRRGLAPRGSLHRGLRRGDDRQPRLRRRGAARLQPLRVRRHLRGLRPALAAARRAGDPAAARVAAQHRDLPAARRALRLHRPDLPRQRRGAHGRRGGRGRPAPGRRGAEPAAHRPRHRA